MLDSRGPALLPEPSTNVGSRTFARGRRDAVRSPGRRPDGGKVGSVSTTRSVDPVTLAVVNGTLKSATREMGITLDRTSRSPVLKLARDYSSAIFDAVPQQLMQGEDIPVHLGGLIASTRGVADYFANEVFPGDVMYHNS